MSARRFCRPFALFVLPLLLVAPVARAQVTFNETGFGYSTLLGDFAKQVEIGVGPDTCLYIGTLNGLERICSPNDTPVVCDENLSFPVGIAFSTGGSFGNFMYVSDYAVNDIHRSSGCAASSVFAALSEPGAIAFPPSGSAYGDYLYTCVAFNGPIYRVSSAGVLTSWNPLATSYLKFGPGGAWGTGMYATQFVTPPASGIVRVSSAGVVTPLVGGMIIPEGFDWGFDGDLFATDNASGAVYRVKSGGASTLFATIPGAADVAWRAGEQALYVVSNQGGVYRIVRSSTNAVGTSPLAANDLVVAPDPSPGPCTLRFALAAPGLVRAVVLDVQGRVVRHLADAWRPAGAQSLAWDGRDDAGADARPGAYFVRVATPAGTHSGRVTLAR